MVTTSALIKRINRKLVKEDDFLIRKSRPRWENDLGEYYLLDANRNAIAETHVDLADYGRRYKVLGHGEKIAA